MHLKLPGEIQLDPVSGQVTARFRDLPQLPFDSMEVNFKGGPRAVLATPLGCGTYNARTVLTPWSGNEPVTQDNLFTIDDGACPATLPFDPIVSTGTVDPVARAFTPFVFRVQRQDGRQELERLTLELPAGVTAMLASVTRCRREAAATGSCSPQARIGTATVGAGAGPAPLYLSGPVYLTDAYGSGQFGMAIVVPAVAGPFDLGTVVVRAAVVVDPGDARLRVISEPLPRILKGVPLRLRDMSLAIDRPGFFVNPTSCRSMQVLTRVTAVQGASVTRTVPFQVGDCGRLPFAPRFSVALTGRGQTEVGRRPGLRVRVSAPRGGANLASTAFTLPPQVAFDASRGGPRMCTRAQLARRACPARSRVGRAEADTPLLSRPLRGPVYFVRGVRGDVFPKLAMQLEGEVRLDLLGSTSVSRGGIRTSFGKLPDVPLRSFSLRLAPGVLTPTRDLCGRRPVSRLTLAGHNGRRVSRRVRIGLRCAVSRGRR
jgi:hypothetical protein